MGRAIPTFAIAGLLVPICLRQGWGFEPWPMLIALTMLALPPIFLTTYTGVRQVDPGAVDASRAMGYRERDVLLRVELALAVGPHFQRHSRRRCAGCRHRAHPGVPRGRRAGPLRP